MSGDAREATTNAPDTTDHPHRLARPVASLPAAIARAVAAGAFRRGRRLSDDVEGLV
ncbi:MAG TPA: hypothetical protein VE287_12370 [Actinopolymorphaceae bacterium]|nr:hypothetical protein [Actinopolymorphaceae bacterium]